MAAGSSPSSSRLNNLGVALREVGRFDEAISVHQEAARDLPESGDRRSEAKALNNLILDEAAHKRIGAVERPGLQAVGLCSAAAKCSNRIVPQ